MNDFYGSGGPPNKHRQFLEDLVKLKLPPAVIEKRWQEYYNRLDLTEKKQVWKLVETTNRTPQQSSSPAPNPNLNRSATTKTTQTSLTKQASPRSLSPTITPQSGSTAKNRGWVEVTPKTTTLSNQSPFRSQPQAKKDLLPPRRVSKNRLVEPQPTVTKNSFWQQFKTNFQTGVAAIFSRSARDGSQTATKYRSSHNLKSVMYGLLSAG